METDAVCGDVPDDGSLELRAGSKVGHEMKQPREVGTRSQKGGARTVLEVNLRSLWGQWFVGVRLNPRRDLQTIGMWFQMQEICQERAEELGDELVSVEAFSCSWIRRARNHVGG